MYRLTNGGVLRLADNGFIPNHKENHDWIVYQRWLSDGNTPEPMVMPVDRSVSLRNGEARKERREQHERTKLMQRISRLEESVYYHGQR